MKKVMSWLAVASLLCLAGSAYADCGKCGSAAGGDAVATCSLEECTASCTDNCNGCPVAKAMEVLPKMTYSVDGKPTCCEHAAKAMAEASDSHMHFVVGEKEFDDMGSAMLTLADVTEKFVNDFATPHTCAVSGKTSVAGKSLDCSKSAAAMADVAKKAMSTVAMTYKIGDEECSCPTQAAALAKAKDAKQEFVIGKTTTCCKIDARIKLAHAKYRAAVMALAKAEQKQEAATTSGG